VAEPTNMRGFRFFVNGSAYPELRLTVVTKECLSDRGAMVAQKRVAIYARVSTVDRGQDPETQLLALREYAAQREFVCA
jgi:predicted site-specific integrase-resolvase